MCTVSKILQNRNNQLQTFRAYFDNDSFVFISIRVCLIAIGSCTIVEFFRREFKEPSKRLVLDCSAQGIKQFLEVSFFLAGAALSLRISIDKHESGTWCSERGHLDLVWQKRAHIFLL